jgi:hypothetical protein
MSVSNFSITQNSHKSLSYSDNPNWDQRKRQKMSICNKEQNTLQGTGKYNLWHYCYLKISINDAIAMALGISRHGYTRNL